jgi:uncharacterized protein YndB with AHSA1/START domain
VNSDTGRGIRIIGSLRRLDDGRGAVTVEDFYDTDIDDLWSAVTDPGRLARWIATVEGEPRLGGTVQMTFLSSGYEGPGRIDVCDAPRRLVVTFEAGTSGESVVEANLTAVGDRTRLIVEERGFPLAEIVGHGGGWQLHAEDLAAYLEARKPGDWQDRWAKLKPGYKALAENLM